MSFDLEYYKNKFAALQQKNNRIIQEYVNVGIKFGQDVAELNNEFREVNQMIVENTPKETKKNEKTSNLRG